MYADTLDSSALESTERDCQRHQAAARAVLRSGTSEDLTPQEQLAWSRHVVLMLDAALEVRRLKGEPSPSLTGHSARIYGEAKALVDADGEYAGPDSIEWDLPDPGHSDRSRYASPRPEFVKPFPRVAELLAATQDRWRMAFHEAGHAVAFLALGIEVTRVEINTDGALCQASDVHQPLALLAGAEAAKMAGFSEDAPSNKDIDLLNQARAKLGHTASIFGPREEATRLILREWPVVVALARRLEMSGRLNGRQVIQAVAEARAEAEARELQGLPAIEDEGDWL